MLKKSLLAVSIVFQVLLVGVMSFVIYTKPASTEIIEDLFEEETLSTSINKLAQEISLPFASYIEAKGVVVPASGYIEVTNPLEGEVEYVFVKQGEVVDVGQPLFKMCDKSIYIEIKEKEARLNKALAQLTYLQKGPSKFQLIAKQKEIEEKEIKRDCQRKEALIFKDLLNRTAVSTVESDEKHMFLQITEKELEKVHAEYDDLKEPMSSEEKEIYISAVEEKKASLKLSTLKLENTLVKSPTKARVVAVKMATGEFLKEKGYKGVVLAKESPGMLKVCVDEALAYKIQKGKNLKAVARHPDNKDFQFVLEYVSFNPKMSIYKEGERMLELYFSFNNEDVPLYLEQSMTVYIEMNSVSDLSFLHYQYY